jgi:hypothetical protein
VSLTTTPRLRAARLASKRAVAALAVAPVAVWAVVALLAIWSPRAFYLLVAEDRWFEWLQVAGFAVAAGGFLVAALRLRGRDTVGAVGAGLAAALFVVVVGEELSWGQRLFGLSVPAVERINDQGDISLHNVGTGLTLSQLGILGVAMAGVLLPVLTRLVARRRPRSMLATFRPPPFLAVWFATAAAFTLARLLLLPHPAPRVAKLSEVAEMTVAVAAAVTAVALARSAARAIAPTS